jgi:hypothetical protein
LGLEIIRDMTAYIVATIDPVANLLINFAKYNKIWAEKFKKTRSVMIFFIYSSIYLAFYSEILVLIA